MERVHRGNVRHPRESQQAEASTRMAKNAAYGMEQRGGDKARGNEIMTDDWICRDCHDTQDCPMCDGMGRIWNGDDALPEHSDCDDCGGTGDCQWCNR
jgi:hypothetical protein